MAVNKFKNQFGIFFVDGEHDTKILRSFAEEGSHQREDIEMLYRFISSDSVVVDIGAHIGTFTVPFAKVARKVYSIEPMPSTFSLLKRNLEANVIVNVIALNCAVSDKQETLIADETPNRAGTMFFPKGKGVSVPAKTLDEIVPQNEKVALIKIDVEGMELAVLRGGAGIIRAHRPVIFFEVNTKALSAHSVSRFQIESFLRRHGYVFFRSTKSDNSNSDQPKLARMWSLYQGYFFDCFAVPKEKINFEYFSTIHFLFKQVKRKFKHIFS